MGACMLVAPLRRRDRAGRRLGSRRPTARQSRRAALTMSTITDGMGRKLRLEHPPRRVVSLVPSLTETLASFGADPRLVGVTRFCTEPADVVRPLRKVGGTKNPDLDLIRTLAPDLVLANREENREEDVEALRAEGIPVYVGDVRGLEAAIDQLEAIGTLCERAYQGERLAKELRAAHREQVQLNAVRPRVRVFCPIWRNPYMSVGADTYAGDLLRLCGGENVFESTATGGRYPQVTLQDVAAADPDLILLPSEPYRFGERHRREFLAFQRLRAATLGHVYLFDGRSLTWYGPRIPEALRQLAALFDQARDGWLPPPELAQAEDEKPTQRQTRRPESGSVPAAAKLPPGLDFQVNRRDVVADD